MSIEVSSQQQSMTQVQRLVAAVSAPGKLFAEIASGKKSWWMPLLLLSLCGYLFYGSVVYKVGIRQAIENQMRITPAQAEKMDKLSPEQREQAQKVTALFVEGSFLAMPLILLATSVVISGVLLGTIRFAFGGKTDFGQVLAVNMYAMLPGVLSSLLAALVLFAGADPESFNLNNPAPTNIAAFLSPIDTPHWLYTLSGAMDFVSIWSMVLLAIGLAKVAGVKPSKGYVAVFGWWVLLVALRVAIAAVQ